MRLLFIDDNEDDVLLATTALRRAGLTFEQRYLHTLAELEPALIDGPWDAVISDYNLGGPTGLDALRIVRHHLPDLPFILVSGTIGDERAAEAIREGAHDYISKDRLGRLPGALKRELEAATDRAVRRHLEASLAEAQQRYRRTFEEAPIGIVHGDRDARIISVNDRYARFFGSEPHELIGRSWLDFLPEEDKRMRLAEFQNFFDNGREPVSFQRRYVRPDGESVWANVTMSVMRDAFGNTDYVVTLLEDVTESTQAQQKLQMQSRLLECVEQAVIATDLDGNVTYWNGVAETLYGWKAAETIGRPIVELTPAIESASQVGEIIDRLGRGESWVGELTLVRRDGTTFPALVADSPMFDIDGKAIGIVGVSHDLTEQKRVENELRANQLQLAEAQEIAHIGSWTFDLVTNTRQVSDGLRRVFGVDPDPDGRLDAFFAVIHPDDRPKMSEFYRAAHSDTKPLSAEFRVIRDGSVRTVLTRIRYMFDQHGKPLRIIGVVQDITEEKQREEELRRRTVQQSAVANLGQIALTGASIEFLLEQAASSLRVVLDVDVSSIFRWEGDRLMLTAGEGWPEGEVGRASMAIDADAHSDELLSRNGLTSGITVLIQSADGTSWGILGAHVREPREFAAHDVEFLRSIASVIGQAIDRSRADLELRTRARQQSAIARLGRLMLNSLDSSVFERACELLMTGINADWAFFGELTPANMLRLRAGSTWTELPDAIPISTNAQAGATILFGEPVVVQDYETETRFNTYEATVPYGVRSGVMVPITSAMQTFGVLSAQSRSPRHFRAEDIDFMQTIANMLAEAMERELARAVIEASEHRYRRIVDGATEIIFTIDGEGKFVALNAAFESITGWSSNDWRGRPFAELILAEDRDRIVRIFERMLREGTAAQAEMTLVGRDRQVHVEVSSFPKTADGQITEVYGFARDVTATLRATAERERVTRNLQLLLESTVEGIFTLDREGRCTMVNRAAAAFLQRTPEALLGQSMHDLMHPAREERCPMLDVLHNNEPVSVNSDAFTRSDGTALPVAYSAAPIFDEGRNVGVVVTFIDLSERRKLEARLEQANRLSSLGRLAATVAHEFNNVLMGIAPFVEVVRRAPSPQKVSTSLDHIANSVKRGRRITQDILRFTQPAEPVLTRMEVGSWLQSVSVEARSLLSGAYAIDLDVEPLFVEGDGNQLHQIFMNLLLNARDAMPSGGTISIIARREPPDARFRFGAVKEPHRYVHFLVTDTGCGMSEDTRQHAFDPLFTTKKNGTGLGLAVTHQVVLRHDGEIFIESVEGEGTTFHIFLPLAEAAESITMPDAAGEYPEEHHSRRILLVEDDATVAMGLTSLLEFEGFAVLKAENGAEAIMKARTDQFDAVLLDVGLPDMDGKAVFAAISELHPRMPIVFSTGHADRGRLEDLLSRPNVSYLLKPYEADSLMDTLARVLSA